ncbi:MAG TPA: T9SS type A sorting domain-containing protein [Rubricoccaceae bacterium]|nr:T9SS type A sorting domain-containing protein [Rubricoccaceae bacterium]
MTLFATTLRHAAVVLLLAVPALALAQNTQQHTTGTVQFTVYNNGLVGAGPQPSGGFRYTGVSGLYEGTVLVGAGPTQVSGEAYALAPGGGGNTEWTGGTPVTAIPGPPAPFNQAFSTTFTDAAADDPIGVSVTQRSYSSNVAPNQDFVVVRYTVTNTSGASRTVHIGLFNDFDVSDQGTTYTQNLANYDAARKLLYVYHATGTVPQYFGVAVLGATPVSGYAFDAGAGSNPVEFDLWEGMTTFASPPPTPDDRRTVIGTGPFVLPAGTSATVAFAYVAGDNLPDIQANATTAQGTFSVSSEETEAPTSFQLHEAYPNPFNPATRIGFDLPEAADVRLAVYDVLGREVAVLAEGRHTAGTHEVVFDAAGLPSGVYVYRLEAGAQTLTRTLTLAR